MCADDDEMHFALRITEAKKTKLGDTYPRVCCLHTSFHSAQRVSVTDDRPFKTKSVSSFRCSDSCPSEQDFWREFTTFFDSSISINFVCALRNRRTQETFARKDEWHNANDIQTQQQKKNVKMRRRRWCGTKARTQMILFLLDI